MAETVVTILLMVIGFYLLTGAVFYIFFIKKGIRQIDEGAGKTSFFFKALIFPGTLAFWPVLLKKWNQAKKT